MRTPPPPEGFLCWVVSKPRTRSKRTPRDKQPRDKQPQLLPKLSFFSRRSSSSGFLVWKNELFFTQSIMYVPLQVNRFQNSILLIVQYKYLKSCSRRFYPPNLILRTRSCVTGFITQSTWVFHFHPTIMVGWKCFVPQLYQFRKGILGRPALNIFIFINSKNRALTQLWRLS